MEMYSDHLAGTINNRLSINTLSPSDILLPSEFGGGRLVIDGAYPLDPSAKFELDIAEEKAFILEFRMPANSALSSVTVNGERAKTTQNERGFVEIRRKWEKGDVIAIQLDYQLSAHLQTGEEGRNWVAFSYGPLALSQKIRKMPNEEPFKNLKSSEPPVVLKLLSKISEVGTEFSIKGTDITLIPYFLTGSEETGSRTYFELKR
jgi:DUF1680 family protein